mmetsp:Transcript_2797/g.4032  ORF Transcript_2797/g.4032 Transcript_2797/m.4032 type:complete len:90 (+) Transcript_2797:2008-2277(+)
MLVHNCCQSLRWLILTFWILSSINCGGSGIGGSGTGAGASLQNPFGPGDSLLLVQPHSLWSTYLGEYGEVMSTQQTGHFGSSVELAPDL